MKIIKSKYVQKMLIILGLSAFGFLSALTYVLGWLSEGFVLKHFLIFLVVIVGECVLFGAVYFLLQRLNKSYFLIEKYSIRLIKNNQEVCVFDPQNIRNIHYIRFFWAVFMQFGAGYLMMEYVGEEIKIKPDIKYPDGTKLYGITMSAKQARAVSEILGITIQIK